MNYQGKPVIPSSIRPVIKSYSKEKLVNFGITLFTLRALAFSIQSKLSVVSTYKDNVYIILDYLSGQIIFPFIIFQEVSIIVCF